jgi:hypothetical protein
MAHAGEGSKVEWDTCVHNKTVEGSASAPTLHASVT